MLEQFLPFIIATPLTERFGFQTKVFTSWISLGLILGLIFGIIVLNSGAPAPNGAATLLLQYLISFPIAICFSGLIGLGINSMRGGDTEHPGWYWWLFPIVTYIVISFWITVLIIGFCLAFFGTSLPSAPRRPQLRRRHSPNQSAVNDYESAVNDWLKENAPKSGDEFVIENPTFKPQNTQEEAVYQEIVRNPEKTIEEIISEMSEEEFEAFREMLMRMLGFTFLS